MQFIVVSGRSGSGKSTALQLLEDCGYTCIDNLPVSLLPALIGQMKAADKGDLKLAVGIDARNIGGDLSRYPSIIKACNLESSQFTTIFLDASNTVLLKRFSETRRKHPLSDNSVGLKQAIDNERSILEPVANLADVTLDTSTLTLHELRSVIRKKIVGETRTTAALSFESFGFKYGMPVDADFVFDVRCLPNPFWKPELRSHTGLEAPVQAFLTEQPEVMSMIDDIAAFISKWLPAFQANNRSYFTVAIGCTGGMHRSVFIAEQLTRLFKSHYSNVQVRHRQLAGQAEPIH
ncbi:RNase adapter RapZ [Marinagarivorans algicola]|uniref:RNase adapter RapZ n=1 Tax=Marinagarivorans algicola TaxID=1513270 RepID=UPI0006B48D4A|nr:RNase adapter RapZ [Marinagarivorans algicola]